MPGVSHPARPDAASFPTRRQIQAALDRARDQGLQIEQMVAELQASNRTRNSVAVQ